MEIRFYLPDSITALSTSTPEFLLTLKLCQHYGFVLLSVIKTRLQLVGGLVTRVGGSDGDDTDVALPCSPRPG